MAVVNVKSQIITDLDATPVVKTNPIEIGGRVRAAFGVAAFAASDATSVARISRIPSRARVTRVEVQTDDLGTGGTIDVGLNDINGGAVVDADFFASALDTDTAAVARTDRTYESGVVTIANTGKRVWEQLGLTADPAKEYDVTVLRNTATATGNVAIWLEYVLDE
jgi:translation initiation factor IF-1